VTDAAAWTRPSASGISSSAHGRIVFVHNLRNRLFLPDYGLRDVPLMISVTDIMARPYLQRAVRNKGLKGHLGVCAPVFVDSGGFSQMFAGSSPTHVNDLIAVYKAIDADVFAALDVPPRPGDSHAVRTAKWRSTLTNLDRMISLFGDSRLMPVVHGRTLAEINRACADIRARTAVPRVVALGGMVPFLRGYISGRTFKYRRRDGTTGSGADFVVDALSVCKLQFPESRVHVFGVGSPTTALALLALGADSVDSLAWRRAAGYGTIFLTGCAERIVSRKVRRHGSSRPCLSPMDRCLLRDCQCPICSRCSRLQGQLRILGRSYVARGVHNVWTLLVEENALLTASRTGTLSPFLASRFHERHRFSAALNKRIIGSH
jgi:7-cyano-7-deazaguanine tRNA-ribosyltransferase